MLSLMNTDTNFLKDLKILLYNNRLKKSEREKRRKLVRTKRQRQRDRETEREKERKKFNE